jgi:hypothetical protein
MVTSRRPLQRLRRPPHVNVHGSGTTASRTTHTARRGLGGRRALIRQVVGKLQSQGNAEAERLREAVRKAMAVLQAAVG